MRDDWLRWWQMADAQLRNLFSDGYMIADLYRTQSDLSRINLDALPFVILGREIDVWVDRLGETISSLKALKPFIEFQGQIVVPDTSAFIEGVYFTEFDWHTLEGVTADEPVRTIIPILVIEELDDKKRDRNSRVSGRARSVLRRLWELQGATPTRPALLPGVAVTVEAFLDDPWHVRRPVNDDEIVDRAVAIGELTGREVVLAAGDYKMLYRASAAGLKASLMSRETS